MRILILQLARFGDIFQTWPVLSALNRKYPLAEIDILVRERYAAAANSCPFVNQVVVMPTATILAPFISDLNDINGSEAQLAEFLNQVSSDGTYDLIINLSFSPLSSFLVDFIKGPNTQVRGYDRQADGFLRMADDPSAYFYAQVGVGRSNRFHLTDVFAAVAEVELTETDFGGNGAVPENRNSAEISPYVVFHLGASQAQKRIPKDCFVNILKSFLKTRNEKVFLVGSKDEKLDFDWIGREFRVVDLCGQTDISDLIPLLTGAKALLAADSMLVQIANLTQTKTLNVTFPSVNFWETGPKANGSRVIPFAGPQVVDAIAVRQEFSSMIDDGPVADGVYQVNPAKIDLYTPSLDPFDATKDFQWRLIQAMYTGAHYPTVDVMELALAFQRLHELSILGLEQVEQIAKNNNDTVASGILDEVDHLMQYTAKFCPEISPLVRWFLAEKSRIAPGPISEIIKATEKIFQQLLTVTQLYSLRKTMAEGSHQKDLTWK